MTGVTYVKCWLLQYLFDTLDIPEQFHIIFNCEAISKKIHICICLDDYFIFASSGYWRQRL